MKEFNEAMIKNYVEFNNCGEFEIEGYKVKFDNHTRTLETNYPNAKELRAWWFNLPIEEVEEETKELSNEEIKKAWNTFKKELKKEINLCLCAYMSKKQIENRTATIYLGDNYDGKTLNDSKKIYEKIANSVAYKKFEKTTHCEIEIDSKIVNIGRNIEYRMRFSY